MEQDTVCISCKKKISNQEGAAQFGCPSCGKYEIVRCQSCRERAIKYICPQCQFEGPN